jgi:hypothetical protein
MPQIELDKFSVLRALPAADWLSFKHVAYGLLEPGCLMAYLAKAAAFASIVNRRRAETLITVQGSSNAIRCSLLD